MGNVKYYIGVATPQPKSGAGNPAHLPDVAPYWRG
jgi:hypothetical protein